MAKRHISRAYAFRPDAIEPSIRTGVTTMTSAVLNLLQKARKELACETEVELELLLHRSGVAYGPAVR
jgi:hypothetical protein